MLWIIQFKIKAFINSFIKAFCTNIVTVDVLIISLGIFISRLSYQDVLQSTFIKLHNNCHKVQITTFTMWYLTVNSGRFFSMISMPPSRNVVMDVLRTRENTSIWWQAVDTEVISPWYPASEINWNSKI